MTGFTFKNFFSRTGKDRRKHPRPEYGYNARILIVDDSRTVLHALKTTLEKAGFKTLLAPDGEKGIAVATAKQPDLILMDLVMPGINGFQATRVIRRDEATKHIPIIIISGNEQASEKFWGTRIGANGFLAKPISRENLFKAIGEVLDLKSIAVSKNKEPS